VTAVATVGSLSRDVVAGARPRPGGAVFYAARAFARIGADAGIVARCGAADAETFIPGLESFGVPVTFRAGHTTTAFTFHYEGDRRVMQVDAVGDPWTVEDAAGWVAEAIAGAEWVQVGALLRSDFPQPTVAALAEGGRRLLMDAQGLVRSARRGPLELTGDGDPELMRSLTALKLNEAEARILAGGVQPERLRALDVPEILLTLGSDGALVVTAAHAERIDPVPLTGVVDPTGAGDSFSAGYIHHRARGAEPVEAARAANALAAEVLGAS
jgi:sugar/nucleoside kinase (ribokinase family)